MADLCAALACSITNLTCEETGTVFFEAGCRLVQVLRMRSGEVGEGGREQSVCFGIALLCDLSVGSNATSLGSRAWAVGKIDEAAGGRVVSA